MSKGGGLGVPAEEESNPPSPHLLRYAGAQQTRRGAPTGEGTFPQFTRSKVHSSQKHPPRHTQQECFTGSLGVP